MTPEHKRVSNYMSNPGYHSSPGQGCATLPPPDLAPRTPNSRTRNSEPWNLEGLRMSNPGYQSHKV